MLRRLLRSKRTSRITTTSSTALFARATNLAPFLSFSCTLLFLLFFILISPSYSATSSFIFSARRNLLKSIRRLGQTSRRTRQPRTLLSNYFHNSDSLRGGFREPYFSKSVVAMSSAVSASATVAGTSSTESVEIDKKYPGTAVKRMKSAMQRAKSLTKDQLNGSWDEVRRHILWAAGLKDITNAAPGYGYTGHSFNDWNHCDACVMLGKVAYNKNEGQVQGIAMGNQLGPGIQIASIKELGPGGTWSTCMMGCNKDPPQDVAHVQFKARIAFKLVWCPPNFDTFVLVDDDGKYLNHGSPTGSLPSQRDRVINYKMVQESKYAKEAEKINEKIKGSNDEKSQTSTTTTNSQKNGGSDGEIKEAA